jgi:hypothetical protein
VEITSGRPSVVLCVCDLVSSGLLEIRYVSSVEEVEKARVS